MANNQIVLLQFFGYISKLFLCGVINESIFSQLNVVAQTFTNHTGYFPTLVISRVAPNY
jgi:hypothetical protein